MGPNAGQSHCHLSAVATSEGLDAPGQQHRAATGLHLPNWRKAMARFMNIEMAHTEAPPGV